MSSHSFTPYYRKLLIPAVAILVCLSGNIALADGNSDVQPQKEDSKKSDPGTDKTAAPAAAQTTEAPVEKAETAKEPAFHRLQARLSGSMCLSCLKDLEKQLLKIKGIEKAKIDRPTMSYSSAVSPDVSPWAQAVILYDDNVLPLETLRYAIKEHGYHSYRVVDRALDHKPEDRDLKFDR